MSILLLTDSQRTRSLFLGALAGEFEVVASSSVDGSLLGQASLVLADLEFRDGRGLELVRAASLAHPRLPIVCMGRDPRLLLEAHRAGADGFLTELSSPDEVRLVIGLLMS